MVDLGEVAGREEDESGTLRSVVEGLFVHGGKPALVAVRDKGVEIWTYGELAGQTLERSGKAQAEPIFESSDVQISPTGRRTVWRRGSSSQDST